MAVKPNIQKLENARVQDLGTTLSQPHSQSTSKASLADIMPLFTWVLQLEIHPQPSHFILHMYGSLHERFHLKTKYWRFYHNLPPALVLVAPFLQLVISEGSCICTGSCAWLMGEASREIHS